MAQRLVLVCFLVLQHASTSAQTNPFITGSPPAREGLSGQWVFGGRPREWFTGVQRDLNDQLASLARQAREKPTAAPVLLAFLTAFLFGMVHAAGPGHGKTFTLSYFLAEKPKVGRGILFGGVISLLDTVSSVAIVAASYLVFRVALPTRAADGATGLLQKVSYLLIVAIGLWHFLSHLRHSRGHSHRARNPIDAHGHAHQGEDGPRASRERSLWPLAISIGLVPCPVEIVILVFGLSIGAFGFGIALSLALSLGQATALGLVALAAMALRTSALAVAGAAARARVTRILELGGSGLIVVFGVVLLAAVW